ncbi:MAG: hypothetical protein RIC19_13220 [Phaeodactylibacter sp.]|uniref:hypothetical protein n=1 Tax=Phaeodactylibacter sp. TaxID=1940289 RepID=UPI0032F0910E
MSSVKKLWLFVVLVLTFQSCKSEYQQYVDREMGSGATQDSLIFGMRIGQSKKEFYATCWELNKQKIITAGTGNQYVLYIVDEDTLGDNSRAKDMLFYGIFDENDIMQGMDMKYAYQTWAPWNRARHADSLLNRLRDQYLRGYPGNDFIELEVEGLKAPAMVKIDGNRQILMYPINNKDVKVRIEDLRYKLKK